MGIGGESELKLVPDQADHRTSFQVFFVCVQTVKRHSGLLCMLRTDVGHLEDISMTMLYCIIANCFVHSACIHLPIDLCLIL